MLSHFSKYSHAGGSAPSHSEVLLITSECSWASLGTVTCFRGWVHRTQGRPQFARTEPEALSDLDLILLNLSLLHDVIVTQGSPRAVRSLLVYLACISWVAHGTPFISSEPGARGDLCFLWPALGRNLKFSPCLSLLDHHSWPGWGLRRS